MNAVYSKNFSYWVSQRNMEGNAGYKTEGYSALKGCLARRFNHEYGLKWLNIELSFAEWIFHALTWKEFKSH